MATKNPGQQAQPPAQAAVTPAAAAQPAAAFDPTVITTLITTLMPLVLAILEKFLAKKANVTATTAAACGPCECTHEVNAKVDELVNLLP